MYAIPLLHGTSIEMWHHEIFLQWGNSHQIRNTRDRAPLPLILLGALRYLGRGWTTDDLEEEPVINLETHRSFYINL